MYEKDIQKALSDLPLGSLRYFDHIGSTNDVALSWASEGAEDLSLVIADEQTSGRGRAGRHWYTPAGSALAFSLILRPPREEKGRLSFYAGLGALGLVQAIHQDYDLTALIKWPNDILLQGRKLAGILVEAVWLGEEIESVVLGMGVNVLTASVPPAEKLDFPAISLEEALKQPVERHSLFYNLLKQIITWRPRLARREFLAAWEESLAYRGELVQVWSGAAAPLTGELLGLEPDGGLRLRSPAGKLFSVRFGEVRLRPVKV
jgi:BirA family biotin operon repressor/biotin-[acetyl-CoA-carboxylase] ligase